MAAPHQATIANPYRDGGLGLPLDWWLKLRGAARFMIDPANVERYGPGILRPIIGNPADFGQKSALFDADAIYQTHILLCGRGEERAFVWTSRNAARTLLTEPARDDLFGMLPMALVDLLKGTVHEPAWRLRKLEP